MNSSSYLLQRRREARLRRFGLGLGGALALAFHLALFWGPRVDYRPLLEQARVRRVLVARPYQPAPPPPQPQPAPTAAAKAVPKAQPKPVPAQPQVPPEPRPLPQPVPQPLVAKVPETVPDSTRARPATDRDAMQDLLDQLKGRKDEIDQTWEKRRAEIEAQSASLDPSQTRWGDDAGSRDGGGYLDGRIRMTVVSYPPTSIEANYQAIPYPDLRFRRAQLEKGTCRVWYRVWLDSNGEIVRSQVKTPSTEEERALYAEFVDQVVASVAEWPFPRQEAEVHVDVFFQIE